MIRVGNFNALGVESSSLEGVTPAVWPFFWNVSLEAVSRRRAAGREPVRPAAASGAGDGDVELRPAAAGRHGRGHVHRRDGGVPHRPRDARAIPPRSCWGRTRPRPTIAALREQLGLEPAGAAAVRRLSRPDAARRSRAVDLPQPAGAVGHRRARRADADADPAGDPDRQRHRPADRHPRRLPARQRLRPGGGDAGDDQRQHPELLARPAGAAADRGEARAAAGRRLRAAGCGLPRADEPPAAAGAGAGRGQLGADPALHPRQHAGRAERRLCPHRQGQGPGRAPRGDAPCVQERADPDPHHHRPHRRPAGQRCRRHRERLQPAGRRQPRRLGGAAARLSGDPGRAADRRRALRADQLLPSTCSTCWSIRG